MNAQNPIQSHAVTLEQPTAYRRARWVANMFSRFLERIDAGLVRGALEIHLPDGSVRLLGGTRDGPLATVHLHRWRAMARLAMLGSVGWYRAWEAGEWTSPDVVALFALFSCNRVTLGNTLRPVGLTRVKVLLGHALRRNTRQGAQRNIAAHYDLGNAFYAAWLDAGMTYSSAIFADGDDSLESAQQRKITALLGRLDLKAGDQLLEIGCGWGTFAVAAARHPGAHVTALTLSSEQAAHVAALASDHISVVHADYRDATGQYDAIASVEMVEAVGQAWWPTYLDTITRCLKPGGRAAIQFISIADDVFDSYATSADFIQAYIFPGGMLLSESRFRALAESRGLRWVEPVHLGGHYAETLRHWRHNFDLAVSDNRLPTQFDANFVALWRYYLMYCEGGFRGGGVNVTQVTLVKPR
jgi:cyclopropane-fatty-acyl-phospholipid synthase